MTQINLLAAVLDRYGRRESVAEFRRRVGQGISDSCRANRHEDCVDGACQCACHAGEDE